MTTTERILERLVKSRFLLNNALAVLAGEKPKWALHYDDVVDAIASVIGKDDWISVDERLPESDNEWVLGWHDGLKKPFPCSFNSKRKFIDADGFEETVTHWQPLPAPPKDKWYSFTKEDMGTPLTQEAWKERPKIDLNEVELLVEVFAEVHGGKTETIESYWRKKIGYTLDDLTPKTDTIDGE